MVDIPGDSTTTRSITVGGSITDELEAIGDHDWIRISLTAGQSISVFVDGLTLEDSYLRIRDASGNLLYENDDITSGVNRDSLLAFTANYSGVYFIDIGAFDESYTGTYTVTVTPYTPPPLATNDQIANQLVEGYWGGDDHHFNVTPGGAITVNLTALNAAGQNLARNALTLWGDIIGVTFNEVSSGGQITFDDNEAGAFADGNWAGGITSTAHVNVSSQWLIDYGTALTGYAAQAYIHEVGHALGLGHAGNYNETARYPFDASFQNDSWATSIMSYFDQQENTYFAGQSFTVESILTPMVADVLAMGTLYGFSTTTRAGDTTYGFNSNAGRSIYDANQFANNIAITIFDSGGIDTIDLSGFGSAQVINLNPEVFGNYGNGNVGNFVIARGVTIENAIGGGGNDELIGNAAANLLDGGGGTNVLTGGAGSDTFRGTTANLSGDTITDFSSGDRILFTNSSLASFSFSLSGSTLTYAGGILTLTGFNGQLLASAAAEGGVQLTLQTVVVADVRDDFNGDGRSDVMWRNGNGTFSVWAGQADGGFVAQALSNSTLSASWQVAGSGDFNGDGRDDVLWRHDSGAFGEWLGLANGGFVSNAAADAVLATSWQVQTTGDFNGDQYDDVIWRDSSGAFMGWFGRADGGFNTNPLSTTTISSDWQVVGAGDFNGDGRDDVLWRNATGTTSVWAGQANGGFVAQALSNSTVAASWRIAGTGDFNGDGRDDILWHNDNGAFSVWQGLADGGFTASPNSNTFISPSWHIAGTGDYNGDGRDDVLWRNDNGAFSTWHGLADGGFVASANSNTIIANSWQVLDPDINII
ncbi:MAG TPA: FG-GAP-like repeat-containing protein [Sphingomicrobium sp.]|nr:FG-GAP-like repeat-containing protein [Sphingomicrobium sp.]